MDREVHQKQRVLDYCSRASQRNDPGQPPPSYRRGFGVAWRVKGGNKEVEEKTKMKNTRSKGEEKAEI